MADREELRLITSQAELRVGMHIRVLGTHPWDGLLLRPVRLLHDGCYRCGAATAWEVAPATRLPACLCMAIDHRVCWEVRSRRDDEDEQRKQHDLDVQLAADMARARPRERMR